MDALHDLLDNEKGLVGLLLILGATALTIVGKMTVDQWQNFAVWIFGIYAGTTALHGGLSAIGGKQSTTAPPNAVKPAAPAPAPEVKP